MPDPRDALRSIEQSLQPREVGGQTVVPGFGPTSQPRQVSSPQQQPQYVGYGLSFDPSVGYVVLNEYGEWVPADPADIRALEKAMVEGGGGGGGGGGDPVLARLSADAAMQQMELAASQEQRAQELHPLEMQQYETDIATQETNLERQMLSDKFTVAQSLWDAAQLADQLATAKRRDAANTLTDLMNNLVPQGMTSLPGLPGSTMPTVATIDFGQFTQGLTPETDAALKFLQQTGQQTTTGIQGLQSQLGV